jgi:hypothetical protein
MRICPGCKEKIPNRAWIDGKRKILNSRKYCLKCSPYGKHNTQSIESRLQGSTVVCPECGKSYVYDRSTGSRPGRCASCWVIYRKKKRKTKILELFGGKCVICGYDKCPAALKFHHVDQSTKIFNISGSENRSWKSLVEEIKKCILVCGNCHDEIHWFNRDVRHLLLD